MSIEISRKLYAHTGIQSGVPLISELFVANFKSIGEKGVEIHPKPLTILTGPNGAGKSSILETICLLAQTIGRAEPRIDGGEYVRYRSPEGFIHNGNLALLFQIRLSIDMSEGPEDSYFPGFYYGYRYSPNEVIQRVLSHGKEVASLTTGGKSGPTYALFGQVVQANPSVDPRVLLDPNIFSPGFPVYPPPTRENETFQHAQAIQGDIASFLGEKFFFISAFRAASKFYLDAQSGTDPKWVGTDGSATNHILSKIFGSRMFNEEAERIAWWADKFSLGGLKAGWAGAGRLKSDYVDPVLSTVLDTSLASHGSRQALTFLTQIFWSKPGTTLVIEEPEISLHPESQTLLPLLFAEASSRGVQIVITTHSPFVVLSLWKPVAEKSIQAKDIGVYHFEKAKEGTQVKNLPVSEEGHLKEWVPSFSSTETKLLKEFLDKTPTK